MIVKNISGSRLYLPFVGQLGVSLANNESKEIEDFYAFNLIFKSLRNTGSIEVTSWSNDDLSHVVQEELKKPFAIMCTSTAVITAGTASDDISVALFSSSFTRMQMESIAYPGIIDLTGFNKVIIKDPATGNKALKGTGEVLYGKITSVSTSLTGTLAFVKDSANVIGTGTLFASELTAGSSCIYEETTRKLYKVQTITDDTHLTLRIVYEGESLSTATKKIVYSLRYYYITAGTETAYTPSASVTYHITIPENVYLFDIPNHSFIYPELFLN